MRVMASQTSTAQQSISSAPYPDLVRFRVLGPVEVVDDRQQFALGGLKQRTVLAVLIANADTPVSADRLIEAT
jgi:hypothetical protein